MVPGIVIYNDEDIENLIKCPKTIPEKPKRPAEKNRTITQKFRVCGIENALEFTVFIACSSRMQQDFSIGLMYENYLLFRCNGFHGTTRVGFVTGHHAYPHGHLLTLEDISNGRQTKPSKIIDLTGKYIDQRTATRFFFETCRIVDEEDYFDLRQLSLFERSGSNGDSE